MLLAYVLTAPDQAENARDALRDELLAATRNPPDEAEFARARARLEGQLLLGDQANAARVARHTADVLHERPQPGLGPLLAEIAACSPDEVSRAAATYLGVDAWCETILGPNDN